MIAHVDTIVCSLHAYLIALLMAEKSLIICDEVPLQWAHFILITLALGIRSVVKQFDYPTLYLAILLNVDPPTGLLLLICSIAIFRFIPVRIGIFASPD